MWRETNNRRESIYDKNDLQIVFGNDKSFNTQNQ